MILTESGKQDEQTISPSMLSEALRFGENRDTLYYCFSTGLGSSALT